MITIRDWLETLGLGRYAESFEANDMTIDLAQDLTDSDLKELGMASMGHRKLLFRGLTGLMSASNVETQSPISPKKLPQQSDSPSTAQHPRSSPPVQTQPSPPVSRPKLTHPTSTSEAERRQLTVMFCDLVGSTELSTKHDPEELREMMGSYQTAAGAVIESYDGHVAQYLGDGLMVYFGWPHAHEDDAVRAVQAGLEVIEAVKELDVGAPLSVRVGIATGPVVVGETGGGDPSVPKTAVGETPNLAARVQGMAEPNTVAIGGITRGLIGDVFELDGLGSHSLKGIAKPVKIYRVLSDKGAESRFDATYAGHLTPVVGRDSEIALQLDRWQRAKDGEGQVILLSGEPGIGKSRLIHMLREKLAEETYTPIRYQCSTHHSNSAFYPVIDQLGRAARFTREEDNDSKLDKLESLLGKSNVNVKEVARLFATLLSLSADRYPMIDATPQQLKEQTIDALNNQLLSLSSQNPVMFLIEDVQWCDPTTLELISDMITRIIDARVLLVITYRPEFEPTWTGHAHVSVQTLNRLSRREGSRVVEKVTGGKSLPKEVLDLIVAKADGIPLYTEELTKNVLEAGFLRDAGDHYELDGPLPALAIPTTLQESLIARLDRLNTVKQIAQIGACIGREFTHDLVATVSPLSDTELQASYQQLIGAEIILPQGGASQNSYIFKHALLQDAAYGSLLKGPKRQFHDLIAEGLKEKFPEVVVNTPELLASHLAKAERFSEAIDHWKKAGLKAKNSSSNQEAATHLEIALQYLEKEEASPSRDKRELETQVPLAVARAALYGYASPKTSAAYERAFELTQRMESPPQQFQILYGLSTCRWMGNRFLEGLASAKDLATYSETAGDKAGYVIAHRTYGGAVVWLPDFEKAKGHLENSISAYDGINSYRFIEEYGHDPKATSLVMLGIVQAYRGFPDQAAGLIDKAVTHVKTVNFPFATTWTHWMSAWMFRDLNNPKETEVHAHTALQIALEKDFSPMKQSAAITTGWAQYRQNQPNAVEKVERSFQELLDAGNNDFWELKNIIDYIDVLQREGQTEKAKEKIERAIELGNSDGTKWNLPEILRRKALILLIESKSNSAEAEKIFLESLNLAKTQQSKLSELCTAVSLARFWGEGQERQKAYDLLFPIYDWYTEGFDTTDVKDAKVLLEQLQ